MDRVRIGLTGLGAVFLLTLGASLTFGAADRDAAVAPAQKEPGELLAQLGVAPSSEKPPAARQRREEAELPTDPAANPAANDAREGDADSAADRAEDSAADGNAAAGQPATAAMRSLPGETAAT